MQQEREALTSAGSEADSPNDRPKRELSAAARRALKEAEERRRQAEERARTEPPPEREIGGRGGKDPVRYGDWEIKGRAIDF